VIVTLSAAKGPKPKRKITSSVLSSWRPEKGRCLE
jgi:hypothetical protein